MANDDNELSSQANNSQMNNMRNRSGTIARRGQNQDIRRNYGSIYNKAKRNDEDEGVDEEGNQSNDNNKISMYDADNQFTEADVTNASQIIYKNSDRDGGLRSDMGSTQKDLKLLGQLS